MSDKERLVDYLVQSLGKAYCDDCLAKVLGISVQQTQELTQVLDEEAWTKQSVSQCAGCGAIKPVTRRRISAFAL